MMSSLWLMWLVFLFIVLLAPIGYGWGYRGWGVPYPRYVQRRRAMRNGPIGSSPYDHQAWGRAGDLVWLGLVIALIWACAAFVFMR